MAKISVYFKRQTSSADIYIDYEAEVEILNADPNVIVKADQSAIDGLYSGEVDQLFSAIREGAETALRPRQLGQSSKW